MDSIRILHVVSTSDFVNHFLKDQFLYFSQKGFSISVACSPSESLSRLSKVTNCTVFPIKIYRSYTPIADLIAIRKLKNIIKNNKFDIVIGHTPKGALVSMIAARLVNARVRVYFRHGILYETSSGVKRLLLKLLEKFTGACATNIVNVSNSVQNYAIDNFLNDKKKNIILGKMGSCGAFDPNLYTKASVSSTERNLFREKYNINDETILIGFIGRLVNDKGISELIEAWKLLIIKNKTIKLFLIGMYEERDALPDSVKSFIASENTIIHIDYFTNPKLIYSLLNIFILPSFREGLPTVILEASSMELPIITTRATGCVDAIIEHETGIFCTHNAENIAKQIQFYIENPKLRILHGINGRDFVLNNFKQLEVWNDFEKKVLVSK